MVDSVTTIGCSLQEGDEEAVEGAGQHADADADQRVHSRRSLAMLSGPCSVASTTLTSEITAPADRSKPPDRMTMVWPIAASAEVAPPLDRKLMSK